MVLFNIARKISEADRGSVVFNTLVVMPYLIDYGKVVSTIKGIPGSLLFLMH